MPRFRSRRSFRRRYVRRRGRYGSRRGYSRLRRYGSRRRYARTGRRSFIIGQRL